MNNFDCHRILLRYRLSSVSEGWSSPHWSYIQLTASGAQVFVTSAQLNTLIPSDSSFVLLGTEQAKKLMVVDYSQSSPSEQRYCLLLQGKDIFQFKFDPNTKAFVAAGGRAWSARAGGFEGRQLGLLQAFSANEIFLDPRLLMKTKAFNHFDLLSNELFEGYQSIYEQWQNQLKRQEQLSQERARQNDAAEAALDDWRRQAVEIPFDALASYQLSDLDRLIIHAPVCQSLSEIKSLCGSKEEFNTILFQLFVRPQLPDEQCSPRLKEKIARFYADFLINGGTLYQLFKVEGSEHPPFSWVYNYVLDMVFVELQANDPLYRGEHSRRFKKSCPLSDAHQRLGIQRSMVLVDEDEDIGEPVYDEDEELAYQLQMQELDQGRALPGNTAWPKSPRPSFFQESEPGSSRGQRLLSVSTIFGAGAIILGVLLLSYSLIIGSSLLMLGLTCLLGLLDLWTGREQENLRARAPG